MPEFIAGAIAIWPAPSLATCASTTGDGTWTRRAAAK
jgi:hypothetical protein